MNRHNEKHSADHEQRQHEVAREAANTQAENSARVAQCDPNETARQAQENLTTAERQGRSVPNTDGSPKSARPRPEVPGG